MRVHEIKEGDSRSGEQVVALKGKAKIPIYSTTETLNM